MPELIQAKLSDIKPYERNPRRNDDSVQAVANSIKAFGFRSPIIVDAENVIIAGHTRYKAAKKLRLKTVPVIVADDMTPEQVEAYRIADNSAGSKSLWDMDLLGDQVKAIEYDLSQYGLDYREEEPDIEEDIDLATESGERHGGTIRFNLTEPQVDIIKQALDTVTGKGYEYGNMNSNGNKLTEICQKFKEEIE